MSYIQSFCGFGNLPFFIHSILAKSLSPLRLLRPSKHNLNNHDLENNHFHDCNNDYVFNNHSCDKNINHYHFDDDNHNAKSTNDHSHHNEFSHHSEAQSEKYQAAQEGHPHTAWQTVQSALQVGERIKFEKVSCV